MNRSLMSGTPVHANVKLLKSKRVLQVLQVSANDKDSLVSPNLMSGKGKKPAISQKKTEVSQDELFSKENTPVLPSVRRSKRKNAVSEGVSKAAPKKRTETKASSSKVTNVTKSKTSMRKNKKLISVDPKQSRMDSFVACSSTSNTILESNLENEGKSSDNAKDSGLAISPSSSYHSANDSGLAVTPEMLTSAKPSEKYWEILAEERRVALAEALRENEELHAQLEVLEAENSQLKDVLKEAENLAEVVKNALK